MSISSWAYGLEISKIWKIVAKSSYFFLNQIFHKIFFERVVIANVLKTKTFKVPCNFSKNHQVIQNIQNENARV